MRPTSWLPLGALALLVGLTLWLNTLVQPAASRADGKLRHDPDLIVEGFNASKLGVDGRVLYTLVARKMVHYPRRRFRLSRDRQARGVRAEPAPDDDHPPTRVGSSRAATACGAEGNVVVVREADAKLDAAKLTTEKLLVLPDEGLARTDVPVRLESGTGDAHAANMELDNRARTIKLGRVNATYKPVPKR